MLSQKNKSQGFTLIEILIALFVFAIIFSLMLNALRLVLNESARAHEKSIFFHELNLGLLLLDRDVQQIVTRPITDTNGTILAALVGSSQQMELTTRGSEQLKRVNYLIKDGFLQRLTWQTLDRAPKSPTPLDRQLISNVSSIKFEYLDDAGVFSKVWPPVNHPTDDQLSALPQAIRVTLNLKKWGQISKLYIINAKAKSNAPSS